MAATRQRIFQVRALSGLYIGGTPSKLVRGDGNQRSIPEESTKRLPHPKESGRHTNHPLMAWGGSDEKYQWGRMGGAPLVA